MLHDSAMSVIVEAEPDLSRRETDAIRRALETLDEADFIVSPRSDAVVRRDVGERADLPTPRLQLRWSSPSQCHYEMVVLLGEYDIRRDAPDGEQRSRYMAIPLGGTRRSGSGLDPLTTNECGEVIVDTPFRDGSHILWDAAQLKLPAYAVWGDRFTKLEPRIERTATLARQHAAGRMGYDHSR